MNNRLKDIGLALLLCMMLSVAATAQNKIDKQVEKVSAVGSATFTSVVERDPDTRQVLKVVKVLKISGSSASSLKRAFEDERESGSFSEQRDSNGQTMTLTCEKSAQVRIYQLRLTGSLANPHAECTVIIKNKVKSEKK